MYATRGVNYPLKCNQNVPPSLDFESIIIAFNCRMENARANLITIFYYSAA